MLQPQLPIFRGHFCDFESLLGGSSHLVSGPWGYKWGLLTTYWNEPPSNQ